MQKLLLLLLLSATSLGLLAQKNAKVPAATSGDNRIKNEQIREALSEKSVLNGLEFQNIGPSIMSGRVVDLAVNPNDPTHFLVAYASGGLWYTENNGIRFEPLFDSEMVLTLGAIAVNWEQGQIWLGTGEVNASRSSYAGTGVYKSNDFGKNWDYLGLPESHHIGSILIHPQDAETCWVAALGHLYSQNPERGVFKTSDGGKTWKQVLFVDENTGAVDLELDPDHPEHLFAAMWERSRKAWNFVESGKGSGIYESSNGGKDWQLISREEQGFPQGKDCGRIGISLSHEGESLHLYACVDNQAPREEEDEEEEELVKNDFVGMGDDAFLALDNHELQSFLENEDFPAQYDSTTVKNMVSDHEIQPSALYEFLTDANSDLFDKEVTGQEVYHYNLSDSTWTKTHKEYLDDVVYSYGYYFGLIQAHPRNHNLLYTGGVPLLVSHDGGKTWDGVNADNLHGDHHVVWINPNREGHLIVGNDGGVNISYDGGQSYIKCNNPPVGQFYTVQVDRDTPYHVYGGLQDNGVWKGPNDYEADDGWQQTGVYPYENVLGGDGMQIAVDTRDNETLYTGYQFGNYYRIDEDGMTFIQPKHDLGERPLRWNWQTPIHLSVHNQDILYMGSNKFHRSMDSGENWETLSGDLTHGGLSGDVPYGTLTSISESPLQFGLLYVGSDDGLVHRSSDGGLHWENITGKLPKNLWVSRIIASQHKKERVYLALNGYRWDYFPALIYVSEDFGEHWEQLGQDLPLEPVNVILEDPENENLLFVGTDNGLYVSLDRGRHFMTADVKLPPVAVHDLAVQPLSHDLILGTHGRSLYKANIESLEQLDLETSFEIFPLDTVYFSSSWGESGWSRWYGNHEPETTWNFYSKNPGIVGLRLETDSGLILKSWTDTLQFKGFNAVHYDLTWDESVMEVFEEARHNEEGDEPSLSPSDNGKYYLPRGTYRLVATLGTREDEQSFIVE